MKYHQKNPIDLEIGNQVCSNKVFSLSAACIATIKKSCLIKSNLKKVVLRCTRITHLIMNLSRTGQPRSPPGNPSTFIKVRTAVNEILIEFQVHPNRWTTFFDFLQFSFFHKEKCFCWFWHFRNSQDFYSFCIFSPFECISRMPCRK